jgi:hypothetical protein
VGFVVAQPVAMRARVALTIKTNPGRMNFFVMVLITVEFEFLLQIRQPLPVPSSYRCAG